MEERKWKAIEPTDVKNAVELFDKDWMVLAAGKEGDFKRWIVFHRVCLKPVSFKVTQQS